MLPAVTLAEFKKQGGILTGREERYDFFQGEPKSSSGVLGDSEKNPLPKELRMIGHEDRMHHEQGQSQDHAQAGSSVPIITRTPTGQGNLNRAPTGPGNLTHQPTGPIPLSHQVQAQAQPQPQPNQPHPHTDPTAPVPTHVLHPASQAQHPSQFQAGTPSTGHFGLLPLQLARSAGDAVRAPMMRSSSRTPQPTMALSAPQSSVAQQVGAQTQRRGSAGGSSVPQQQQQGQQQTDQQGPQQPNQQGQQ